MTPFKVVQNLLSEVNPGTSAGNTEEGLCLASGAVKPMEHNLESLAASAGTAKLYQNAGNTEGAEGWTNRPRAVTIP